jgi:hypothetical protein
VLKAERLKTKVEINLYSFEWSKPRFFPAALFTFLVFTLIAVFSVSEAQEYPFSRQEYLEAEREDAVVKEILFQREQNEKSAEKRLLLKRTGRSLSKRKPGHSKHRRKR